MRIKYPRTFHLPYSKGFTKDDKVLKNDKHLIGREVVITEKMDGENTTIYRDGVHARSIESKHMGYHSWLLNFSSTFMYNIPEEMRICGEYMYAQHSIRYNNLKSFFLGFSVWNGKICLDWESSLKIFQNFGIDVVPIIYRGLYNTNLVNQLAEQVVFNGGEGLVVRLADSFHYNEFDISVAKYVRNKHVTTGKHWKSSEIKPNKLG